MPYYHVKVLDVIEDKDTDGNTRHRASVVEVMPRKFLVNLKDDTAAINQLNSLIGRNVMLPGKENQMNGQLYLGLVAGEPILPMPDTQPMATDKVSFIPTATNNTNEANKTASK